VPVSAAPVAQAVAMAATVVAPVTALDLDYRQAGVDAGKRLGNAAWRKRCGRGRADWRQQNQAAQGQCTRGQKWFEESHLNNSLVNFISSPCRQDALSSPHCRIWLVCGHAGQAALSAAKASRYRKTLIKWPNLAIIPGARQFTWGIHSGSTCPTR
jgi:hypothetical protein